ncbi:MAG: hypothetical protein ABIN57_08625 [Chitinophagaceae bacterium]
MNKSYTVLTFAAIISVLFFSSCKKIPEGYLSENIRYQYPTIEVERGVVKIANENLIFPDGSTLPLNVKLLDIRDKATGKHADAWFRSYDSYRFISPLTATDTTMELFNKRIEYGKFPPFDFVASGGYFRFNTGTKNVPVGEYEFDLEVSNVKGTKQILNAATIVVKEPIPYVIDQAGTVLGTAKDGTPATHAYLAQSQRTVTVEKLGDGKNQVFLKIVDKNGKPFNPKTAIQNRLLADGSVLNDFTTFSLFDKTQYTDSTMSYNFGIPPYPFKNAPANSKYMYLWIPAQYVEIDQFPSATNPKAALTVRVRIDIKVEGTWLITIKALNAKAK